MEEDNLDVDSSAESILDEESDVEELDVHLPFPQPVANGTTNSSGSTSASPSAAATRRLQRQQAQRKHSLHLHRSLPYACESLEEFDERLEHVAKRLAQCVRCGDYSVGLVQWNHKLSCLMALHYPMLRSMRARLARLFYHVAVAPAMEPRIVELAANTCMSLIEKYRLINIHDLVLPWRPLYSVLKRELFPKQRKTGLTDVSETLLDLAEYCQRFFDPSEETVLDMLRELLPEMEGIDLNSVISVQAFLVHFLPITHPQRWLPVMFRLWQSFSSSLFDDQMLDLLARLAQMHVSRPESSSERARRRVARDADPVSWFRRDADAKRVVPEEEENDYAQGPRSASTAKTDGEEGERAPQGLFSEVGIFTEEQFALIMTKCLRSAGLPVGSSKSVSAAMMAQSSATRTGLDASASSATLSMKKPSDRLQSFATIIVFSISPDSQAPSLAPSSLATAEATPAAAATPTEKVESQSAAEVAAKTTAKLVAPLPTPASGAQRKHLAGSRALHELAKFIQATESYFHPSNWGAWQMQLSSFVQLLTFDFLLRIKQEQRADCKTPVSRRITPEIRREFCLTLRTVCLLSMFSKDPFTIGNSQAALKRMAVLEPDLVVPAVVERAFASLEALETTHRTNAIISSLSHLSVPMVSRELYPAGGKHLVPLLELCLPGIDLNDPLKTMSTGIFVLTACLTIKLDDLTRPELQGTSSGDVEMPDLDGEGARGGESAPKLTREQEDELLRVSTGGVEDWVVTFFRRVLALFDALPEEGKSGRTGGKSEENVIRTVIGAADLVCASLGAHLFDLAFRVVADHCLSTTNSQGVRVLGMLVNCFARADSAKVMKKLLPVCIDRAIAELDHGASSTPTTNTSLPAPGDTTLHWNVSIITGALAQAGTETLKYRPQLLRLLKALASRTRSERGYSLCGRLLGRLLATLLNIYPADNRPFNPDEWAASEGAAAGQSHQLWGKMYTAKDVVIPWHVPSDEEIEFALELLDEVAVPSLEVVEQLQRPGLARDKLWSNDFCRHLTHARTAFIALAHVVPEPEFGGGQEAMDIGDEVEEFVRPPERFKACFLLPDEADPRHARVRDYRDRFGRAMRLAAQNTKASDAEDQIDCVRLLIRSIRTYMTTYAYNAEEYNHQARSLAFFKQMGRLWHRQKANPRGFWLRRAHHYHQSRARLCSFHRKRTPLHDELIVQMVEWCMSTYTRIRISAQSSLSEIASFYDGTRLLGLPKLLEAVKPGVEDDRMKGALYVLGSTRYCSMAVVDARVSYDYVINLLLAQHHPKPSIQKLVRGILADFEARYLEPTTLRRRVDSPELDEAAALLLERGVRAELRDVEGEDALLKAVDAAVERRTSRVDELHARLTPKVLEIVANPTTHWAFTVLAAKLLRGLIRKDRPLQAASAGYFARQATAENPRVRSAAQSALTRVLYFVKLRTLCKDDQALLLGDSTNPLKRKRSLPRPVKSEWARQRWLSFADAEVTPETMLQDKDLTGWLVWAEEESYYEPPHETKPTFSWEAASADAIGAVRDVVMKQAFWDTYMAQSSQEKERNYLSADSINFVKSLTEVFGAELLDLVRGTVDGYVGERDRHKHRAAAEMISGVFRGSKHWPLVHQRRLWEWLQALFPRILRECTPDSQPAWQMCVEYIMQQRDPRRAMPLVTYLVQLARESIGSDAATFSPFEQARAHNLLRGTLVALSVKFTAWEPEFTRLYSQHLDHDFAEVRAVISESLTDLDLLRLHPSFGSLDELLDECATGHGSLLRQPDALRERLASITTDLEAWRKERVPTAQAVSRYDRAALTTLMWMSSTLGDHRKSALAEVALETGFLRQLFSMLELHDNAELSRYARSVLNKLSTYTLDAPVVALYVKCLLDVIRGSTSWRSRLDALPVLQVVYFQNIFYLEADVVHGIMELLCDLLRDPHLEVREMAATTLSGIVRCSQRQQIDALRRRFVDVVQSTRLPPRGEAGFGEALQVLHSGVLGVSALIGAFPYEVPAWMPDLICSTVALQTDAPQPVSTTARRCASEFKRTHADTWTEDKARFTPDQLAEVLDWTTGRSDYYA